MPAQNTQESPMRVPIHMENLPKKNSLIKIIAVVAAAVLIFSGGYFFYQFQNTKSPPSTETAMPAAVQKQSATSSATNTAQWKTYTNTTYGYSINYPSSWEIREFPDSKTGAAFRPQDKPNDYQYEYITINRYGRVMFDGESSLTFEEYVKKAGAEIQNYKEYASMKKVVTDSNITGLTTTWKMTPLGGGKESVSPPRTYFEIPGDDTATIQVVLDDIKYIDVYNQMLTSFTFIQKEKKITNPNLKTYTSTKLGLSFTYLAQQNSQEITVTENGNKICVSYQAQDAGCEVGQFVEVFEKGATETLKAAITRIFLAGKDLNRCIVSISDPENYPETYVKGEITFPPSDELDMEKMFAETEYCSSNYAQTNGIRYFIEDKLNPTKFLFFSIGQYGIASDNNKAWQETAVFE